MTNNNTPPETQVELNGTGSEHGTDLNQVSDDNGAVSRVFGIMNLWSIRRNGRKFKLHGRMPRL